MTALHHVLARASALVIIASALTVAAPGCDGDKKDATEEPAKADKKADAKADVKKEPPAPKGPELVDPKDPNEACARVVYVAWKGAADAPESVTRDEETAKKEAEALREKIAGGADIVEIARASSDHEKSKAKDSGLGTFTRDKLPDKYAALAEPLFGLKVHETSPVIRTEQGFVIVQRCAVDKVHTRHILVRYKGAAKADDDVKRSKEDAQKLADKILADAKGGKDFATLAEKHGEDGSSERGGDLGEIGRGMFVLEYEKAAWALKPGDFAPVVETKFGFHIIQRMPAE